MMKKKVKINVWVLYGHFSSKIKMCLSRKEAEQLNDSIWGTIKKETRIAELAEEKE